MKISSIGVFVAAAGLAWAGAGSALAAPAAEFSLPDTQGKEHSLSSYAGKVVVLEWLNFGCPFVKKHYDSKNMQALQKDYTAKGVVWLSIVSSAPGKQGHYPPEKLEAALTERGAQPTAALLDSKGAVGRLYGAKTTPHMFVIDAKGALAYAGAIDDAPSTDVDDVAGARNYVREAVDALLAGKRVKKASTKPYGCSVKY